VAVFIVAKLLPGIEIKNFGTAIIVALVYSVINFFLGKILFFFALPVIVVTLGLFTFIIDAFLLWLTDKVVDSFKINNFGTTILAAFLITLSDKMLNWIIF